MFGIVIDSTGIKTNFIVVDEDNIPEGYILKDSESIVTTDWNIANTMLKPKWESTTLSWIETATEEEIKKAWEEKNKPLPEDQTDLLKMELAENTKALAKKDLEVEQLQKDIADITKQLALGGNI
ncbi:hypothetical protein [Clostridium butyricum]|uniref:Uncharacterized protein n=1 Tax=Clostridium butyricum TaxID=1492 RepID=A0A2S7F954_CLOBU|nr:hypothetical protein [Clostridium butyricum]KHD14343.1 hypothetical protein OA81_15795 [Clostridium butyricum]PPV13986.1 hypothetical protein AWN73_15100 [Clostridium butyricum]